MSTNNYIKHQGPRKNSKYHQGVVDPKKLRKYFDSCKNEPVIYRSGLEYQFIQFCENSPTVAKWASEVLKIPYYSHLDGKECNYYPDYVIENHKGVKCVVELKLVFNESRSDSHLQAGDEPWAGGRLAQEPPLYP